jgi:hypothetical protein
MRQGSCYVPGVNAIFIGKFELVHAAEEAAHFVNFALKRQRYRRYRCTPMEVAGEFYLSALEEALGYFGSKLIDPRRDQTVESLVLKCPSPRSELLRRLGIKSAQIRWMREFILAHKEMERDYTRRERIPPVIRRGLKAKGPVFTVLTHELGYLLGEQMYRGYVSGLLSRRQIARLYATRFEECGPPFAAYLDLAERLSACWTAPSTRLEQDAQTKGSR